MKSIYLVIIFLFFYNLSVGQEYYAFIKVDSTYRKKNTTYYFSGKTYRYYVKTKKNKVIVSGVKSKLSNHLSSYLDTNKNKNLQIDSNLIDNSFYSKVPLIGYGDLLNGQKSGKWYFFEKFTHKIHSTCEFQNGKKNGLLTLYFNANQIATILNYVNDIKHGKYIAYNIKGRLVEEGEYENDTITNHIHYFK